MATEYIDVIATYNPLAFGAEMTKPSVCLDGGQVWRTTWTTPVRFAVAPGAHLVEVWAAWIAKPEMGRSGVQFTLVPGVGATVSWRVPPTVFQKGKMTVVSGLAAKAVPVEAVQHHAQPSPAMAPRPGTPTRSAASPCGGGTARVDGRRLRRWRVDQGPAGRHLTLGPPA